MRARSDRDGFGRPGSLFVLGSQCRRCISMRRSMEFVQPIADAGQLTLPTAMVRCPPSVPGVADGERCGARLISRPSLPAQCCR
jgi:hypothetical protein